MRQHYDPALEEMTITLREVLKGVQQRRPYSRTGLLGILNKLQIRPVGKFRTHPSHYPPDTVNRVLDALGEKVVTMTQLRAERAKSRRAV